MNLRMYKTNLQLILFCICMVIAQLSLAQDRQVKFLQADYKIQIKRTSEPIAVDGKLEEKTWDTEERASNFWMSFPVDGRRADEEIQTEIMLSYDDQYIYIGAICKGAGPYVMPSLKRDARDFFRGDVISVVLDPVNEQTNSFFFGVNTAGVQFESLGTGQTGRRGTRSSGVNVAWDNIWLSEVALYDDYWTAEIAIPFKSIRYENKDTWGINFVRGHSGSNSFHTWSPVPVQFRGMDLGYTGALIWDKPPPLTKSNISIIPYALASTTKDIEDGSPTDNTFRIGGDAKIAISSTLNLDLTINPDFSQVDVDEQVTNLTTVNLRFPEKRLFFLENSDLFADFGIPPMRPFFSRKIGLDEDGNAIPIVYGARISGNLNKDLRIGIMNLQTRAQDLFSGQNYTSATLHQRVLKRSIIKGYFHNRQATKDGGIQGDDYNRTAGLEFSYRSTDGRWQAFSGYGKSWSPGLTNDNYFYNIAVGFDSRTFGFYSNISGIGNNYRADMGFIPRFSHYNSITGTSTLIGFNHGFTTMTYSIYPKNSNTIASHRFNARNILDYTKDDWELIQNKTSLGYSLNWSNSSRLNIEFTHETQGLLFPFAFVEDKPLPIGEYAFNFIGAEYQSDRRKALSWEVGVEKGSFYNGDRTSYSVQLNYRVQPWGNFSLRAVQNDLTFPDEYGETKLFLLGPKAEVNFSRELFWTTFLQYNTQRDNFNINSRIQWRYKPMSDLFIVYSENYATDVWGSKNRGIVLKVNYWLNV